MIYHLFQLLEDYDIPGQGLMTYLSFRAMLASVTAMLLSLFVGRKIIHWLQKKQIGETIRDLGLEGQMQKKGTPTMGGVIILLAISVSTLLFCDLSNIYTQLLIFTTLWCGGIGFADDYIKVFKHNKEGMSERWKLILQIVLGFIVGLTVCFNDDIVVREKVRVETADNGTTYLPQGSSNLDVNSETIVADNSWKMENIVKSTKTTLPFIKSHEFDYKWLSPFQGKWGWYMKWAIYVLMIVIVITACSNGTNLTDGMDGLAAGTSAIVGIVIGILAWLSGNLINSNYLNIMYIPEKSPYSCRRLSEHCSDSCGTTPIRLRYLWVTPAVWPSEESSESVPFLSERNCFCLFCAVFSSWKVSLYLFSGSTSNIPESRQEQVRGYSGWRRCITITRG